MEEAVKTAETKDRIHLKNTFHAWARKLEQNGDFQEAAKMYEKANTHRYDVPRMFVGHPEVMESYMAKTDDPYVMQNAYKAVVKTKWRVVYPSDL